MPLGSGHPSIHCSDLRRPRPRWSLLSVPVLTTPCGTMLLRKLAPHVPRNFSFLACHADDKEIAVRPQERGDLTVPQLSQENACHCCSNGICALVELVWRRQHSSIVDTRYAGGAGSS